MDAYLEVGNRKTFAGVIDWPGWCRSGRDETAALESLLAYSQRYKTAIAPSGLAFKPPDDLSGFQIVERLEGNATTEFGAPDRAPSADAAPIDRSDAKRYRTILEVCWQYFDLAVEAARGHKLQKGPRGGGRELEAIVEHVVEAEQAYLRVLGWKVKAEADSGLAKRLRQELPKALEAAARGDLPSEGPRGGKRWAPRYYVRRSAWHLLDHAWEIEDRVIR